MEAQLGIALLPARLTAGLLGVFGAFALLLAGVGLYGVMAYTVGQRTREIGIRMALGASSRNLVHMILRQTATLLAIGLAIGSLAGAGVGRAAESLLYGVSWVDATAFGGAIAVIAAAVLVASVVPARRAVRVDPVDALRVERALTSGATGSERRTSAERPVHDRLPSFGCEPVQVADMKTTTAALTVLAVLGTACAPTADEAPATPAGPFDAVADMKQLMLSVVEPAAEVYWDSVGVIMDLEGTTHVAPSSPAEWQAVRDAAMVVAESGNLLMLEGRALDQGAWMTFSGQMIERGREALTAAESEDADAVFYAGGELYLVCASCHATYAPETLRPNDPRSQ